MFMLLIIIAEYVFIPPKLNLAAVTGVRANDQATFRLLSDESQWQRWWPQKQPGVESSSLNYNGADYTISKWMFQSLAVNITKNERSYNSRLDLVPVGRDSFAIEWKADVLTGSAPIQRYRDYRNGKQLEHDLHELLSKLKPFLERSTNLYGIPITEMKVKDSIILMATVTGASRPETGEIYIVVNRLKALIEKTGAGTTNYPMLNIDSSGPKVITRIGIPIDREIEVTGTGCAIKRTVLGNILVSEVKGGPYTSKNARKQMELYMIDHERRSPAIPYESLVVDRSAEPDTSKWVTRIYYPVY